MRLVAIILTYNEAEQIASCLEALRFADRIIVFDSFSTDATPQLATSAGARVIQHAFVNYADQRNAALEAVVNEADWVLFVDADEKVTPELALEVRSVIEATEHAAYRIPRHNYIFGRLTLGAGWYPDYQTRLLRVGAARYDPAVQVHEVVLLDGTMGTMAHPLIHHNYRDLAQFHAKQKRYSDYDAQILFDARIRPKPQNYVLQPLRQFWWRFVTLKGYSDGWHGLKLSVLMAWYEGVKYVKLRSLWHKAAV